jgi:hypothetical protein
MQPPAALSAIFLVITGISSLLLALYHGTPPSTSPFIAAVSLLASAVAFGAIFLGSNKKSN